VIETAAPPQHQSVIGSHYGSGRQRLKITVQGIVQGVGFRPFVYSLARQHDLAGYVLNDAAGVTIEAEGAAASIEHFLQTVRHHPPPLARIEHVTWEALPPNGDTVFIIKPSHNNAEKRAFVSPDVCICSDCLGELFDPADRRYHYPFINCTNCGPRFTIVRNVPYDRHKTTMQNFPLCVACQAEYDDPLNRRFHAQPNACPACGPQPRLLDGRKQPLPVSNPIAEAARLLAGGAILAIKGLGGYHLACDALNTEAVARLRSSKHREAKPFALMASNLETIRRWCHVSPAEADLLRSRRRPIVLLTRQPDSPLAPGVAPLYQTLGLMLPYTPLHYLLLRAFTRAGADKRLPVLVMTSANRSDEPIAYRDDDALERLAPMVQGWLTHNRDIHVRCDDSVARIVGGATQIFRRARGYTPEPIRLARSFPLPVLACGGHLKNTFCLGKEDQAFVSHHIGDLENLETLTAFRQGIEHFQQLFDIWPEAVAYDLHPEYLATKHALALDARHKIGVQHHHAHVASVLAEHGLAGAVIGVAADGTGYGLDEAVWGGEIMVADLTAFERVAHLAYVPLPGGQQAIRQPWRMAAVYLAQAYGQDFPDLDIPFTQRLDRRRWRPLAQMMARNLNSPPTSSLGRLFDAVAALLGVRDAVVYEGQAAIELETVAIPTTETYPFAINQGPPLTLDVQPMIRAIVLDLQQDVPLPAIAGRFHRTIAALLLAACQRVREESALNRVALSGGVFQNRLLLEQLTAMLQADGFQVYRNRLTPPNDGGLSLGQAAVAAARLAAEKSP